MTTFEDKVDEKIETIRKMLYKIYQRPDEEWSVAISDIIDRVEYLQDFLIENSE